MALELEKDVLENEVLDARLLNEQMTALTHRVVFALDALTNLNEDFRLISRFLLKSFN